MHSGTRQIGAVGALFVSTLALSGCAFDEDCRTPTGECEFTQPSDDASAAPDGSNDVNAPDAADATTGLNSANSVNAANNVQAVCPMPTTCGPEPDERTRPLIRSEAFGCPRFGEFEGAAVAIDDALCEGDSDWHGVMVRPCEERAWILEATVTPEPGCDERLELRFQAEDGPKPCDVDGVQCETLDDGSQRMRVLIPAEDRPRETSLHFVLDSTGPFDAPYTIRVRAYQ